MCFFVGNDFKAALAHAGNPRGRDRPDHDHLQARAAGSWAGTSARNGKPNLGRAERFVRAVSAHEEACSAHAPSTSSGSSGRGACATRPWARPRAISRAATSRAGGARAGSSAISRDETNAGTMGIPSTPRIALPGWKGASRTLWPSPSGAGVRPPPAPPASKPPGTAPAADKAANQSAGDILRASLQEGRRRARLPASAERGGFPRARRMRSDRNPDSPPPRATRRRFGTSSATVRADAESEPLRVRR